MLIRSEAHHEGMRLAGAAAAGALREALLLVSAGTEGARLDAAARASLSAVGARPAAELIFGFPGCISLSIDAEAAHGPPGPRTLGPGNLAKLDIVAELNGYYADCAVSLVVEPGDSDRRGIALAAREVLARAIASIRPGSSARDLGAFIEDEARLRGYTTLVDLAGHGIGRAPHEGPDFLECHDNPGNAVRFQAGMVLAVELFLSSRDRTSSLAADGWTLVTNPGNLVAQAEATILVSEGGAEILTPGLPGLSDG